MTVAIALTVLRDKQHVTLSASEGSLSLGATDSSIAENRSPRVTQKARFIFTTFALVTFLLSVLSNVYSGALYSKRNFYGVIRVRGIVLEGSNEPALVMSHGITVHGLQFTNPNLRDMPTTYYVREGGAGLAILNHPKYGRNMRVGLLGLGVGTLATYGQPGDVYRLYEINPVVIDLAEGQGDYFSFLKDSNANITTVLGDASQPFSAMREYRSNANLPKGSRKILTCWSWTRSAVTRSPFTLLPKKPLRYISNTLPLTASSPPTSRICISICNLCSGN